jgi:hypothetical protein
MANTFGLILTEVGVLIGLGDPQQSIGAAYPNIVLFEEEEDIDITAPIATLVSPPLGDIPPSETIVLEVEDERELRHTTLWVEYPSIPGGRTELIYGRGQFQPGFGRSTVEVLVVGKKHRFSLRCDAGWRGPPYVWVEGVDAGGNVS